MRAAWSRVESWAAGVFGDGGEAAEGEAEEVRVWRQCGASKARLIEASDSPGTSVVIALFSVFSLEPARHKTKDYRLVVIEGFVGLSRAFCVKGL